MALTPLHLQTRLSRFEFEALFCRDLGWAKVGTEAVRLISTNGQAQLTWQLVAEAAAGQAAIVVTGPLLAEMMPQNLHHWLDEFIQVYPDPLVVWVEPQGQRSLWCWRGGKGDPPYWRTRWLVKHQGDGAWATRLLTMHRQQVASDQNFADPKFTFSRWLTSAVPQAPPDLLTGLQQSWQTLTTALATVPTIQAREHYSMVILCRLIAITALQQRGYLGGEDDWYLHNQFGQSQQRGRDQFFHTVFQPLCQQGLTLPPEERPLPVQNQLGPLPFLPTGPFTATELDQQWGQVPIPDAAFEPVLTWLGDLFMTAANQPRDLLLILGEHLINGHDGGELTTPEPVLHALCDRTINAVILDRAAGLTGQGYASIDHLLMAISPRQAAQLLECLGNLTLLDPACGSGRFLVTALNHLTYLALTLKGIAGLGKAVPLPQWLKSAGQGRAANGVIEQSTALATGRHLLTHSIYGLDLWAPAVELTRLQLFLQLLAHTTSPQALVGLPDLTLTTLQGNSLIGLVTVEAERFEQVQPKSRRGWAGEDPEITKPLQGNLLQPLLADNYQGVLAERQVRLEHYRSQTQLLAEVGSVPAYAQSDFLRDRLQELNHIAQDKLTHLLWNECSQQVGIRVQYHDAAGRRQTRPLELPDVEALAPFHWGFYFHQLLQNQGGFDVILSHFPGGTVQPSEAEFVERYQDLFQHKNVAPSTFLRNRKQVLNIDADLARAWCEYRGTFSLPNQYFRRSGHYSHASRPPHDRASGRLYWSRLFLERSLQLLCPGGRCGLVLDPFWDQANSAPLRYWLQANTELAAVVDVSNHGELWPTQPSRMTLSLLWLKGEGSTQGCPYLAYNRAGKALTGAGLGHLLQGLIDLAE